MSNEENKTETLGNPSHQNRLKVIQKEKEAKKKYMVVEEKVIVKNGKRLKIMTMSDKSKKQIYLGKEKPKKKLIVRDED